MDSRHVFYILGFLTSLLVAISISAISRLPSRYAFSVLFGILVFLIFIFVVKNWSLRITFKRINDRLTSSSSISRDFFILLLYAVSIALVLLIPSNNDAQFVVWARIPLFSYVRLFAGLLLSSILPGFGLLRLIDRKKNFKGLNLIVFSFFTGVFVTTFLSYILMVFNVSIQEILLPSLMLNLIILSLCSFVYISNRQKRNIICKTESKHYTFDYIILACIFTFFIIGWVIYY